MEQAVQLERRVRVIPATRQPTARGPRHDGKRRVAAYCRVSTDSEEQLNSYDAQKSYYTQRIEENPDWELAGIFADEGITGTSMKKRTEFKRMIAACKRGRIDMILTKSLSRFARNTVDCLDTVRVLKANGIGVIFEKENINTLTESSEFLITLFSGFAQAESESLSKNVRQGKQFGMKDGIVHFQYKKLLGYRRGENGQPEIVPEEAETIRRIYRRYLEGASEGEIKKELEADNIPTAAGLAGWSHRVVHSILTNEKYIGDALLQKTYVTDCISKKVVKNQGELPMYYIENHHQGIIPKELFQRVQEEMARRTSKRKVMQKTGKAEQGKYSAKYALSELLVCGECGTPYKRCTWSRNGKKRIVWRCVSRLEFGTKYCRSSPTLDEGKLHNAIVAALNRYGADRAKVIEDALAIAEIVQSHSGEDGVSLLTLQDRLKELSAEQDILLDKVLNANDMDDLKLDDQLKILAEEKQSILEQMASLQQDEKQQALRESRRQERDKWLEQQEMKFTEYDDIITRRFVEKITVVDSETVLVKIQDTDVEIEQSLC